MSPEALVHYVRAACSVAHVDGYPGMIGLYAGGGVKSFYPANRVGEFDWWTHACAWMGTTKHSAVADAYEHLESLMPGAKS